MEENQQDKNMLHNFDSTKNTSIFTGKILLFLAIVVFFGIGSGYFLAQNGSDLGSSGSSGNKGSSIEKGTTVGSDDTKTFKDSTQGVLKEGGIDGEGQFHLIRPGGDSQNVYLTSSIVDLSLFIDKKIKVWGETNAAEKAGWLMDVGKVEVLE